MKLIASAVGNIAFVLVILNSVFYQTSGNNFLPSKSLSSINQAVTKLEIKENRRIENVRLLSSQEENATKLLIAEGSSTTEGYGVTNEYSRQLAVLLGGNYFKQTANLIFDSSNKWTVRNVGDGGDTMIQMTAQYSSQVLPFYNPSNGINYLTLQAGSNDIANGRTTAALKSDVAAYVARAKAQGFNVGVCTVFHRVGNDVAKVSDYNNWLRTGQSGADFIVDLADHPALSNANNLTYFQGDGIHTNNSGQAIISDIFVKSIPTAESTSVVAAVSGRILAATGRSIPNAVLTLTDDMGITRIARTSSLGYYYFKDVTIGKTYRIAVKAKRFTFSQSPLLLNVDANTTNINFTANP